MNLQHIIVPQLMLLVLIVIISPISCNSEENVIPALSESQKADLYTTAFSAISKGVKAEVIIEGLPCIIFQKHDSISCLNRQNSSNNQSSLPLKVGEFYLKFMDNDQLTEYYKKAGKFPYLSTSFKKVEDGFKIMFSKYLLSYGPPRNPDSTNFGIHGISTSYTVYFKFDFQQKKYVVDRIEEAYV